jgi:hypothetical protein
MSREELLAYWREQTNALRELQKTGPRKRKSSSRAPASQSPLA